MTNSAGGLLLLFLLAAPEEPLVTDRPDATESAVSVEAGRFQLEAGIGYDEEGDTEVFTAGQILLRIGLGAGVELRLAPGSFVDESGPGDDPGSGIDDASLGVKVELGRNRKVETALLLATSLPTGNDELGEEELQPEILFSAGWEAGGGVGIGLNLGYRNALEDGERFDEALASLAVGLGLSERVGWYGELFGTTREGPGDGAAVFFDTGFTWLLSPDLQLDALAGYRVDGGGPDPSWFVGMGVSRRW